MHEENVENVEKNIKDILTKEQKAIVKIFESINLEYPIIDIINELKRGGYIDSSQKGGDIVLYAIYSDILDVSSIEDDGMVYVALGMEGEEAWKELGQGKDKNEEQ